MNDRGVAREAGDAAPPSLYFNPQLIADSRGRVAIEFVMPPAESEYRLLIDALGHGRLGSAAYPLVCRGE